MVYLSSSTLGYDQQGADMGGNALKNVVTRRYNSDEYYQLREKVFEVLRSIPELKNSRMQDIPAYRAKDSFGDLDVLIEADGLNQYIWQKIRVAFSPRQFIRNDQVTSFNVDDFQVDISLLENENFDIALSYYSYNDLGNLIGRIAESMNLKFGHQGLFYQLRDDTGNLIESIPLSKDIDTILPVLGLDPVRWRQGFDTLEDIFAYVMSSTYAKTSLYILENRNYKARVRDSKRSTYNKFLAWLSLQNFPDKTVSRNDSEDSFLRLVSSFSFLPDRIAQALARKEAQALIKKKYSGGRIAKLLNLEGTQLSLWMDSFKGMWENADAFEQWVLSTPEQEIDAKILENPNPPPVTKRVNLYRKDIFREALPLTGKALTEMMTRFPQQWPTMKAYNAWFLAQTKESFIAEIQIQYEQLKDQLGHFSNLEPSVVADCSIS